MGRAHRERDQTPARTDDDVNLTKGGVYRYIWNAENRLVRVRPKGAPSSGDVRLTYVYDYLGRRVRKTVETHNGSSWAATADTRFVWYNWLMLLELDDSDDVLRKYSWGLDLAGQAGGSQSRDREGAVSSLGGTGVSPVSLDAAGGIGGLVGVRNLGESPARSYVYFCDGNGNVVQAINRSSDTIDAKYEYDAYGNNLLDATDSNESGPFAEANPFRFSTKYYDGENEYAATVVNEGTYSYIFRDYWPRLGRWGSEDPIGITGGFNRSLFTSNSAVSSIDARGLSVITYKGPSAMIISFFEGGPGYGSLANGVTNSPPPNSFASHGDLLNYLATKEYRNFLYVMGGMQCCNGNIVGGPVRWISQSVGHTNNPGIFGKNYFRGTGSLQQSATVDKKCLKIEARARFRVNWFENTGQAILNGLDYFPYAWTEITYIMCCDGSLDVIFDGSLIPSHKAYVDYSAVASRSMDYRNAAVNASTLKSFRAQSMNVDAPGGRIGFWSGPARSAGCLEVPPGTPWSPDSGFGVIRE